MNLRSNDYDVAIVGGGAAGLATAIFAARRNPSLRIGLLESAKRPGAKILVSGGGRCNVTNRTVRPEDFLGGNPRLIARALSAFSARDAERFFVDLGVRLHEEPNGKLFPDSNSARTVLEALLGEVERLGVHLIAGHRVTDIAADAGGFALTLVSEQETRLNAGRVVLATGGQSLPKTGSDGFGYELARRLGHSIRTTTPALAPLLLDGEFHVALSGISHDAEMRLLAPGCKPRCLEGALLWTHFGVSGPLAMNASRFFLQAVAAGGAPGIALNFLPGGTLESAERRIIDLAGSQPRTQLHTALATLLPARVALRLLETIGVEGRVPLAHLNREDRLRLATALTAWPLPVRGSRGYGFAEATAGGVPLEEIQMKTMESRRCPGLHLVGEILDVDGRIGGFNFQWAWSSGFIAGQAVAREG